MFTGIITDIGTVREVDTTGETRFVVSSRYNMDTVAIGASIAHDGCCLTVVEKGRDWHAVEVSAESLSKTNLGQWKAGSRINLERALAMGDELGGHVVSGHVDGLAEVSAIRAEGMSTRYTFTVPDDLAPFVAPKGSVALNGVSLTVNEVDGHTFGVNIIPHTQQETTFGLLKAGDKVNMEIDMLARYVARLLEFQ